MNKIAIKNFAVWARNKLIAEITYKAGLLGITENGIAKELPNSEPNLKLYDIGTKEPVKIQGNVILQRKALSDKINAKASEVPYKKAFEYVIEEVAYTWFNRLIAIRYMEVKGFLPVRVLSSESKGKKEPDMVTAPFETEIEFTESDRETMLNLKDDELFRFLFIKQCNQLHEYLPELFEQTDNYTELLLPISFTDEDGIVFHLVNDISEEDFGEQVQIIGWLYQYYNTEPKDKVFSRKSTEKIQKEEIPAATQLFTPDWIVRYMVENSLGRLWVDGHEDYDKSEWKYYLAEAEQEESVKAQLDEIRKECKYLSPVDIKFLDPCMGSGHILVYAFDVFMQIYLSQGYTERDAASKIIENNLFGLDIDKRAYQLSYFALMMKGREADRRFLKREIKPNLYAIEESNGITTAPLHDMGIKLTDEEYQEAANQIVRLIDEFHDASTYGSLIEITPCDWDLLKRFAVPRCEGEQLAFDIHGEIEASGRLQRLISIGKCLSQKYDVVCTNPPYMRSRGMNNILKDFVDSQFSDSRFDLFAAFIERCSKFANSYGYFAMITQHTWMFLSSYEDLRTKIQFNTTINMAHLGARAFDEIGGEVVQTTAFVKSKSTIKSYGATYVRLVDEDSETSKRDCFLSGKSRFVSNQEKFAQITGSPIGYWISDSVIGAYAKYPSLGSIAAPRKGNSTSDNNRFLRLWYEVDSDKMNLHCTELKREDTIKKRWYPYNKGGGYRKWYGFNEYLIDWYDDAAEIRKIKTAVIANYQYFMKPGLTWSTLASNDFSIRWFDEGYIFDNGGCCIFELGNKREFLCALLNSKVFHYIFGQLNPTLNFQSGEVAKFPVIYNDSEHIKDLALENVRLSKNEYDSFETSWDFKEHPFVKWSKELWDATAIGAAMQHYYGDHPKASCPLELCYLLWQGECNDRRAKLKANEEELNRIFIDIYGLQDELTPEVKDDDVTVRKADLQRDMRSFVSYAVGCMFGRYSLDTEGLAYAGGEWDDSKYKRFIPDKDNCIPITDTDYFEDDIVNRFVEFVKVVYGDDTLEQNLKFIANALGKKGISSRDVIREYFIKDFMKDHVRMYQKRPIYWLFDSGKQNGFKALVYMHRWNLDTIGNVRVEYLHKLQRIYDRVLENLQDTIDNSDNSKNIAKAEKQKDKITKQLKETRDYDEKIAHLAHMQIDIDLDDGVNVNYEKVQTAHGNNLEILAKR